MSKKVIITDFEYRGVQYIVDTDLVVCTKLNNQYYNIYTIPEYIKSLNPLDPNGLEKLKLIANVEPTLYRCQSSINLYKDCFSDIINIKKENIDEIIDKIIE